ncbi:uncharacterized protein ColSpa_09198 [Colletotrichum spaethianum]|uniref:Uncharacterized protein n=1 Tax=Colletotrichum spaethianum TaxID=700344 RepID=A0AA37PB82_9PEZI|nr:uncharacterized protein ColSpa_09198 [Colletotrichum spaethianum]GKT49017.1 hypothetical protein ColSpa_09198 [Colletotrichum spaethianum]
MPSLRAQASTHRQPSPYTEDEMIKRAMMDDLGTIRIDELPLDDTPKSRAIPPRPRRAPVITEHSEALNGYLAMAEKGIDDAEALAVRDLNDLGGPSIYRPIAGPSKNFVAEARRPPSTMNAMKTSQNSILLAPGTVVRRFTSSKGVSENAPVASNNMGLVAGLQSGNNATTDASKKPLPPHLRMQKKTETPLSNKSGSENGNSIQASKSATTNDSAASHAKEKMVRLTIPAASEKLPQSLGVVNESKKSRSSAPDTNIVKHNHHSDQNISEDEVVIYWTGSCRTWLPEQGKECTVTVDLKIINTAQEIEGQSLFVMTLPKVFVKRHSMRSYLLGMPKNESCVVQFVNPDTGVQEGRYHLKFENTSTATEFQHRAALLQKVMGYLSDVAAASNDMAIEPVSATEETAAKKQPLQPESSVTVAPLKDAIDIAKAKNDPNTATEDIKPSKEAEVKKHTSNKSRDITDVMTDAFNNLSLNKVKDADMYKANRQRVQYSAKELLKQRSSAEAPSGITEAKIPLQRHGNQPKIQPPTQDSSKHDNQSMKPQSIHDSAKLRDWMAGKKTQPQTKGGSEISMPGLSDAVRYQKAVAVTAKSSIQTSRQASSENKFGEVIADKEQARVKETLMENDRGTIKVNNGAEKMGATEICANFTALEPKDANINIEPEVTVAQATPAEEAEISSQPNKSDDGAADSNASSDSAVEFQTSPKNDRPSTVATNQNDQKTMDDPIPPFEMAAHDPTPATGTDKQDGSVEEAPSAVVSEAPAQTIPMLTTTMTPAAPSAVRTDLLYGLHSQTSQEMCNLMPEPQLASPQISAPLVATPHMIHPHATYVPQMNAQPMIPGIQQYPPIGIVHAVSVTYHISHAGQPDGQRSNAGQVHVPVIHHVTDFGGHQTGRALSPDAQAFQPQFQGQVPQGNPGQNRMRRGLESSIFATGHSGAKHAGRFTGASSE